MLNYAIVIRYFYRTILVVFAIYLNFCYGFNLDLQHPVIHWSSPGTMFGFSVALHMDRGEGWLLIGAPEDQTSQPGVVRGGAVYRCSPVYSNSCQSIPFDSLGHGKIFYRSRLEQTDDKSYQWFGASVHSSGHSGVIVACAPRYVYFSSNLRRRDPIGTCWVSMPSFSNFKEYSPCRTNAWGYHRQGSCQAGFSAALSKDGKKLFIGAVGSWYWQGQVFSQNIFDKQSYHTKEAPEYDDDSYMGYSVAVGEFTGDKEPDVAVGMPRGNNLSGKVLLFNSTLRTLKNITGEQIGSYFGYSVVTCDINGDGLDDVIIGAPLFSNLRTKSGNYEMGRIYIYYQTDQHNFEKHDKLDGTHSRGRFGLALTSLGDINKDLYSDIAVSSPYGGENGRGIVYVFHGSKNGIIAKPSQILKPSDFGNSAFSTFGFSLSGGIDLDNNGYPDLLIGAYESSSVIFVKSRPIVTVAASLKIQPEIINLDEKGCNLGNGTVVSCIVISVCLEFTGINVSPDIGILYEMKLDTTKQTPRLYFLFPNENLSEFNVSVHLRKHSSYCRGYNAYIKTDVRDKLEAITVQVLYSLLDAEPNDRSLSPILNEAIPSILKKEISIRKNCGKDNMCIPDLQVFVDTNMERYVIGSDKIIELEVTIKNEREDAFEATLYLFLPLEVNYINIENLKTDVSVSCSGAQPELTGTNDLVCDIGNPLPANSTIIIKVLMSPSDFLSMASDFIFNVIVNSTNGELEETLYDNQLEIHLPIQVEVDVIIRGLSDPKVIEYNKTEVMPVDKISELDAGPEVTHIYAFGNRGPSTIQEAEINILWPTYTLYGKHLLYLMEQPEVRGKGRCQKVRDVNPLMLKNENKRARDAESDDLDEQENFNSTSADEEHWLSWRKQREIYGNEDPYVREMFCGPTLCTRFYCTVFQLYKDEQVFFIIRSRLWKDTIDQLGFTDVQISSKLVTRITSLPFHANISSYPYKVYTISTRLSTEEDKVLTKSVPLWIIIVSVSSGLLLFGFLALLLWKFGFFRRRRPQDELLDTEPLRKYEKNGYVWSAEDVML